VKNEKHYDVEFTEGAFVPVKYWTRGVAVEEAAKEQIRKLSHMPFLHKHVAVMPDCHHGRGSTVGTVIATKGAIIPAAVGVDLGCGMMALETTLTASELPDTLAGVRAAIERAVPAGRTNDGGPNDVGAWRAEGIPDEVQATYKQTLASGLETILAKHPKIRGRYELRSMAHLSTLGTGNHFIEVCVDERDRVWVMLHSGSRGIGNRIGTYFIEKAKEEMRRFFVNLPDEDLAYLPDGSKYFDDYMEAVSWAQDYAHVNRLLMMKATVRAIEGALGMEMLHPIGTPAWPPTQPITGLVVNCHHNYVARERHFGEHVLITRKGAVRAMAGDMGIIPGAMGRASYIVRGKGSEDAFHSCSHGAGRLMSRGEAKRRFTVADHVKATEGVECLKDASVLDETPDAYKPLTDVMAAQADLVEIVHTLRALVCVKGGGSTEPGARS
jgi:tRNA-splicing ligase RtcB (3'-phosphate/5'-hydroxy nucleic acid ligase)